MPRNHRWDHLDKATCYEPDCDRPRSTSPRSGRVYQRCDAHERELRARLRGDRAGDRLAALADRRGWSREVDRTDADRTLADIAALPRVLPEVCNGCFQWEMWTGQARECRACRRGLRELATNDEWRSPSRPRSRWSSR